MLKQYRCLWERLFSHSFHKCYFLFLYYGRKDKSATLKYLCRRATMNFLALTLSYINTASSQWADKIYKCYIINDYVYCILVKLLTNSSLIYYWKIFAKLTSAQNWRKPSVSPISLTPSGTSSTKNYSELHRFVSWKCVTKRHFKNSLRAKVHESLNAMFELVGSKYGVCSTNFQSFEKFSARQGNVKAQKLDFLPRFLCVINN